MRKNQFNQTCVPNWCIADPAVRSQRWLIVFAFAFAFSFSFALVSLSVAADVAAAKDGDTPVRPNILWLTAEDIGPELGCYGDTNAVTPIIDAFAKKSLRYDVAWSSYPVCAPARTTIITGAYACVGGAGNMRSKLPLPKDLVMFPALLRKAGYYCTNNSKEDYNYSRPDQTGKEKNKAKKADSVWDDSSKKAHYKNRQEGQPFFAVFNYTKTHESKIRNRPHKAVTDPDSLTLPPFWPDVPEVRTDLGQYYDNIREMDGWLENKISELKKDGSLENTIVFFYGDHGSGMPRFKRYAGDTGYRVAMLVYIPPALRTNENNSFFPGGVSERMVGFVDLGPTVLSLAGIEPPKAMLGQPWFGKYRTPAPEFLYGFRERMDERIDLSHCIRDRRYQYCANYYPHLPAGQKLSFQMQTPATAKWRELFEAGKTDEVQSRFWQPRHAEEFYDLGNDPWATSNLIDDPNLQQEIKRFQLAHQDQTLRIKDLGFLPETIVGGLSTGKVTLEQLQAKVPRAFAAAQLAVLAADDSASDANLLKLITSGATEEKTWALRGIQYRKQRMAENRDVIDAVRSVLSSEPCVAVEAADCLLGIGQAEDGRCIDVLLKHADSRNSGVIVAIAAINALERHQSLLTDAQRKIVLAVPRAATETRSKETINKLLKNF